MKNDTWRFDNHQYNLDLRWWLPDGFTGEIAKVIINQYKDVYPELERNGAHILEQLKLEEGRFARTLKQGEKEFEKIYNNVCNTKTTLETILNVPRVFLSVVLKGCVDWAKENNVELITAEHMKIINDKRSKEKNKK